MINQRQAFNRHTTTQTTISVYQEGHYDERNRYIDESLSVAVPFSCTPIPFGDRDSGTSGEQLSATDVGERKPAYMQIHSRTEMPMKSIINIYGIKYKVVRIDEYGRAGFHRVIAAKELDK
ncbi:hypothetical protein I6H07_06135 [Hafnia alvei]|nr:hypothetical protein [Hafnia alvei]MBI0275413.1 hypothetical protein [Hafnia alvei]PNK98592.1 hypothetical protein CEQ28_013860 [Hafnia alvei]